MVIINAVIHTLEKECPLIENGFVRFEQTTITALGRMQDYQPQDETVYDAKGHAVYPGFAAFNVER